MDGEELSCDLNEGGAVSPVDVCLSIWWRLNHVEASDGDRRRGPDPRDLGEHVSAAEKKAQVPGGPPFWMEAIGKKLDLSDDQKKQLKAIHENYKPQYEKLWHEERDEMSKVLTPEQLEKAKEMMKAFEEKRGGEKKPEEKEKSPDSK